MWVNTNNTEVCMKKQPSRSSHASMISAWIFLASGSGMGWDASEHELQGIDTGMVSYDGIVYASLETGVASYCNI